MKNDERATELLGPVYGIGAGGAYHVPRAGAPTDLRLDGNEGRAPRLDVAAALGTEAGELLRRYPDAAALEGMLAARLGVDAAQVVVTAGADDAILRLCTAVLGPDRELVLPVPTFEMIERYAALRGCTVHTVPWPGGPYPVPAVEAQLGERTSLVAVVSPNNPTGAVATAEDLRRLAAAAPRAVLLVDLAYVEFADEDLTAAALALPNAVVLRTLSKAYGLAGLRVGYAVGPPRIIDWLRQAGNPFPVSSASLAFAAHALDGGADDLQSFVAEVRSERREIAATLERLGVGAEPSQANFVFARLEDATWMRDALAGMGIAVRAFPGRAHLEDALRITCPGDAAATARLVHALQTVRAPAAAVFDMDGVLADVSRSYRAAILATAAEYGVNLTDDDVTAAKRAGNANDDWILTRDLLARHGVEASLAEVTARFERRYQGADGVPGLRETERLTAPRAFFARLAEKCVLGIATGRPRADAERFLAEHDLADLFACVVCREDGPLKPFPDPLRTACKLLGVTHAWYVGDTVDDVRAARAAGLLPVGVVAPGEEPEGTRLALTAAGAGRVLSTLTELEELLP